MLHGDALTAFKTAKGMNGPQSELAYKKTMEDVYTHMFPLRAYATQTRCIHQTLIKPHNMSLHTFIVHINKVNDRLEQFPPRDNKTPQYPIPGKGKCVYRDLTAWPKDRPSSSISASA
eukprot:10703571-Ditylum_brightwellii.AAC.2